MPPKKTSSAPGLETELYAPVRDFLKTNGYTVRGEVRGCDIAAEKDGGLLVVELKRRLNLELLIQATQRQRVTPSVYVAVPRPEDYGSRRWRRLEHLLRRLEIGLILVAFAGKKPQVHVLFHPIPFERKTQSKQRRALLREIAERSQDLNEGGSTKRKIVTAYREQAVQLACCLAEFGAMSPRELRALGASEKAASILYNNYYGWFDRVGRALYDISAEGRKALDEYPDLVAHYRPNPKGDPAA